MEKTGLFEELEDVGSSKIPMVDHCIKWAIPHELEDVICHICPYGGSLRSAWIPGFQKEMMDKAKAEAKAMKAQQIA